MIDFLRHIGGVCCASSIVHLSARLQVDVSVLHTLKRMTENRNKVLPSMDTYLSME